MDDSIMTDVLNFSATVIVAIIGLIGICIQTKSKEKQDNISMQLDLIRSESKQGDESIKSKIDKNHIETLKVWLVTELTKIRDEVYVPNEEQKALIHEAKREYNRLGGDSYVDTMFDNCIHRGLL